MKLPKLKSDNKGLSLVEMLISFAILSIVTVALMGLMTTGMRFFRSNTAYIGLQYEYQTVMTQLREYVVDCNGGIVTSADGNTLYIVNRELTTITVGGATIPATEFTTHAFRYDPAEMTLYYIRPVEVINGLPDISTVPAPPEVSTRVADFAVNVRRSDSTGRATVTTDIRFVSDTREYQAAQDIATRNRVAVSTPAEPLSYDNDLLDLLLLAPVGP